MYQELEVGLWRPPFFPPNRGVIDQYLKIYKKKDIFREIENSNKIGKFYTYRRDEIPCKFLQTSHKLLLWTSIQYVAAN